MSNGEIFILHKMVEGDESAFKYFFDTYYDDLCNFVNSYIRDEIIAEDIVQNIFIYLWEKKELLPPNCSIKSYLYAASKNKSLNYLRNQKNKAHIIEKFMSLESIVEYTTDQYLEIEELKVAVGKAVNQLPEQCKKIYQQSRDHGFTNKEIAAKLGISLKTVENQMTIAIRKIKENLRSYQSFLFAFFPFCLFF